MSSDDHKTDRLKFARQYIKLGDESKTKGLLFQAAAAYAIAGYLFDVEELYKDAADSFARAADVRQKEGRLDVAASCFAAASQLLLKEGQIGAALKFKRRAMQTFEAFLEGQPTFVATAELLADAGASDREIVAWYNEIHPDRKLQEHEREAIVGFFNRLKSGGLP